jgi:hypothetical protein
MVSRPMLLMVLLSQAYATDSPRYSKKCASLTSQPRATQSWPVVAMARTPHARDANPHHVGAVRGLRTPQRLGRHWTDTLQTRATSSRNDEWAASMRYMTVRRTTGVDSARPRRATTRLRVYSKRARFAVNAGHSCASEGLRNRPTRRCDRGC